MAYNVKFLKGSQSNFDALKLAGSLDKNTFYYVDEQDLYLGSLLLTSEEDVKNAVTRIEANAADIELIKAELDALSGGESGGGSITTQISNLRDELKLLINANTTAITAEETRAKGVEEGLASRIATVEGQAGPALNQALENQTAIATINGKIEGIDDLKTTVANHTTQINTLIGEDNGKTARAIALEELTKQLVPETAQESMDTLAEIAAWIQAHPGDASAMNAAIGENTTNIAANASLIDQAGKDIKSLEELFDTVNELASENQTNIASIQELLAGITHADNGILAQSKNYTNSAIEALGLGTASKKNVEDFDAAGSASAALAEANAYTDNALTWGTIVE